MAKKGVKEPVVYRQPDEELPKKEEEPLEEDLNDDEVEPWEEGFEEGEKEEGQLGKDALTGEAIVDATEVIELEWEGRVYRFINQKNADLFLKKKKGEKVKAVISVKKKVTAVKKKPSVKKKVKKK